MEPKTAKMVVDGLVKPNESEVEVAQKSLKTRKVLKKSHSKRITQIRRWKPKDIVVLSKQKLLQTK